MEKYRLAHGVALYISENSARLVTKSGVINFYNDLPDWKRILQSLSTRAISVDEIGDQKKFIYLKNRGVLTAHTYDGYFHRQLEYFSAMNYAHDPLVLLSIIDKLKICIVGLGGAGANLAMALAKSGFRHIDLVDWDSVEVSNLNRSFFFEKKDIGSPKVEVIRDRLKSLQLQIEGNDFQVDFCSFYTDKADDYSLIVFAVDHDSKTQDFIKSQVKSPYVCINYGLNNLSIRVNNLPPTRTKNLNMHFGSPSNIWISMLLTGFSVKLIVDFIGKNKDRKKIESYSIDMDKLLISHSNH